MSKHEEVRRIITAPVLTTEQVQALEKLRQFYSDPYIVRKLCGDGTDSVPECLLELRVDEIHIAVIFGYDIELSVEQQIGLAYMGAAKSSEFSSAPFAYRQGLHRAWTILQEGKEFPYPDGKEPDTE